MVQSVTARVRSTSANAVIRPALGALVVALAMAACGGDGGGTGGATASGTPDSTTTPPAAAASATPALPVPVWTLTDLSTWPSEDVGSFVIDVSTGEAWRPLLGSPATSPPTSVWILGWSPGGEALVVVRAYYGTNAASAVYAGAPGGSLRHLLDTPGSVMSASWSPDGDVIALGIWSQATGENAARTLVVGATTGAVEQELGQSRFSNVVGWSSGGRQLALFSDDPPLSTVTIWNRDTGDSAQIAASAASWAHRGHRLAYMAAYDTTDPAPPMELHVRDFDSGDDRVIATDHGQPGAPRWSPDDRSIAFGTAVSTKDGASVSTKAMLHIVDSAGSQAATTIQDAAPGGWLDGGTLYFLGDVCKGFDIYTVRADGSQLVNHTRSPEVDLDPWSAPDGRGIAFTTVIGRLRLLSLADGTIRDLANILLAPLSLGLGPTGSGEPWSPDGRYLAAAVVGGHGLCDS